MQERINTLLREMSKLKSEAESKQKQSNEQKYQFQHLGEVTAIEHITPIINRINLHNVKDIVLTLYKTQNQSRDSQRLSRDEKKSYFWMGHGNYVNRVISSIKYLFPKELI